MGRSFRYECVSPFLWLLLSGGIIPYFFNQVDRATIDARHLQGAAERADFKHCRLEGLGCVGVFRCLRGVEQLRPRIDRRIVPPQFARGVASNVWSCCVLGEPRRLSPTLLF